MPPAFTTNNIKAEKTTQHKHNDSNVETMSFIVRDQRRTENVILTIFLRNINKTPQ